MGEINVEALKINYSMPDEASLKVVSDPAEDERVRREEEDADIQRELDLEEAGLDEDESVLREEEDADIQRELDLEEAGLEDHEPERGLGCEDDALRELERVLATAEWEAGSVSVEIDRDGFGLEREAFTEASAFVFALAEVYRNAWNGSAPFDGGVPAIDCDEFAAVEEVLDAPEYEQAMALAFP